MRKKRTRKNMYRLFEVANSQEGYFTAKQAEEAGFVRNNHVYYVKTGQWVREERGIYRHAFYPKDYSPMQQKALFGLWSCNREGEIEGVYSYETALDFYDLTDLNPAKLHMTVPKHFRRMKKIPEILGLHKGEIPPEDVTTTHGFKITTLKRTMRDVLESQHISPEFVEQAALEVVQKGLMSRATLFNLLDQVKIDSAIRRNIEIKMKRAA